MPKDPFFDPFESPDKDYFSQFEEVPSNKITKKKDEEGLLSKAWNFASEPPKFITDAANKAADYIDNPKGEGGYLRGFGAGALQGASSLLSPLNVISTVAPESGVAKLLYGTQLAEGADQIRKGNYLSGAADIGMGALGFKAPGIKTKGKLGEVFNPPEISPKEIPSQKLLSSGTYHVNPEGKVGTLNELNPEMTMEPLKSKPKVKPNPDGTFTDIKTGDIYDKSGNPVKHIPTDADGVVTVKDDFKLKPQIKEAEVVSEVPNSVPSEVPEVRLKGAAQEYIDAVKTGKIDPGKIKFVDYQKDKESILARLIKEESGSFTPLDMFRKIKGVDDNEANKVRETIISSLIQGGRLDLEGIYGKTTGINRKQFNRIVDEIIDTKAVPKIAEQIKVNTPEPIQRLLGALRDAKITSEVQAAQISKEKGERISAFSNSLNKGEGKTGFLKAASNMAGEYLKPSPIEFKLGQGDTDALFEQIKNNKRITEFEKLKAGLALRDLLEGTRTLQKNELMLMDRIYGPGVSDQIIQMHGGLGLAGLHIGKTANTMKSLMATLDLSAPFRQGIGLATRKEFYSAFSQMFKYAGSRKSFMALEEGIESHPNYLLSRDAGLFIADHNLGQYEEQFMNSYLGDVSRLRENTKNPIGRALLSPIKLAEGSERAYVGFLNKLRFDTFNNMLEGLSKQGYKAEDVAGPLAKYINVSTGRGELGKAAKYADGLNTMLFSPRLISSRLTILNPKYYVDAPDYLRKDTIRTLLGIAGVVATADAIGSIMGGKLKGNSLSSDFGKIKFGNTRLDPGGGFLQYVVLGSRLVQNKTESSSGKTYDFSKNDYNAPNRWSLLFGDKTAPGFIESKFSPMASFISGMLRGKDFSGQPFNTSQELKNRFTPLIVQDIRDVYNSDPSLLPLGLPAAFGMGLQTYQTKQKGMGMKAPSMDLNLRP